jgi:hypothetical protein
MEISSSKRKARKDIKQNSNRNQFILGEKKNDDINGINTKEKLKQNIIEGKSEIETLKIVLNNKLPKPKKWDENKIWSFGYHKVLLGYLNAYFDHCPIKVSPNIIWQLILNLFSKYVNDYSEKLRNIFVNFEGKKDIECIRIGKFKDVYEYEDDLIDEFCKRISENIGTELTDILTPNFTTSTKESIIAGKVSIMSTFKKYFNYRIGMVSCGIPYILLEGNLEDWKKILEKLKSLSKCGFSTKKIEEDIIEIINTKEGKINLDFWRKIIMETKGTITEEKDCMDVEVERELITGWILDFYNKTQVKKDDLKNLKEEVISAPVTVKEVETGETRPAVIYAGIRDLKQDPNTFIVEPIVNYCFSFNEPFCSMPFEEEDF